MKRLLLFLIIFSVCLFPISTDFELEVIPANTPIPLTPSGEDTHHIDATHSVTYGSISNPAPSGMGTSDLNNYTTLQEGSYQTEVPTTLEFTDFDTATLPSGWSSIRTMFYVNTGVGGYGLTFYQNSFPRSITTKSYDLRSYTEVTLDFTYASYDTNYIEKGDYKIRITYDVGDYAYVDVEARTSETKTAHPQVSQETSYQDVVFYFYDDSADDAERLAIDDVEVCGIALENRYRFEAVFKFNSVELGYKIYTLYVVFYSALSGSDDLDFYLESGDTTPDNLIADNKQDSFSVDVTNYINDTTVYLMILDDYRDNDAIQTNAYISAIYLVEYYPEWRQISNDVEIIFHVPLDETVTNWLLIFLGLFMIPASTMYLVKGGKDAISSNKFFFFCIAFVLGWALFLGGIYA